MNYKDILKKGDRGFFFKRLLLLSLPILLLSALVFYLELNNRITLLKETERNKLELQRKEIVNSLAEVKHDIMFLKDIMSSQSNFSGMQRQVMESLKEDFLYFIKTKPVYDQLRYIDAKGNEIIRINDEKGRAYIVPDSLLQNKSHRYYFQQMKEIGDSDIYFSKFDLNVEGGRIEMPFKPVIRVGMRITNNSCEKDFCGIVLLNFVGNELIKRLEDLNINNLSEIHLIEPKGYLLVSPDPDNNWGFMVENRKRVTYQNLYPKAWAKIANNSFGQFNTSKGLFTFTTLNLSNLEKDGVFKNYVNRSIDEYWKLISIVPKDKLTTLRFEILNKFYLPVALLFLLSVILSYVLAYLRLKELSNKFKMKKSNDFLISVINSIAVPMYVIDVESQKITLANKEAHKISLFENGSAEDNSLILSEDNKQLLDKQRKKVHRTRHPIQLELKQETNEAGHRRFYDVYCYPILNEEDNVSQIIEVFNDVTDEKISERKFKDILASSPDGMIITNADGQIVMLNRQAEEMFEYKPNELIGEKVEILIPKRFSNHKKHRENFASTPEPREMGKGLELVARKKTGKEFPVEISLTPIESSEGLLISSGIRDITERKDAEMKIRKLNESLEEKVRIRTEALEKANRFKSEFLANMSHEIRTPMNSIIGFTELLGKNIHGHKQISYLNSIKASTKNLLRLINDILDLAKVEAGKLELQTEPVDLKRLIEEVEQIFTIEAKKKNLEVSADLPGNFPQYVELDETRLRQILFNLLGNAIKFTEKGSVEVQLSQKGHDEKKETVDLEIRVKDTGIGISSDERDTIFESFKQQDGQSNKKYGGTGLGLAITKRLVEIMGGTIIVESEMGKGSTFIVDLKGVAVLGMVDENEVQSFNIDDYIFEPTNILVVDDNDLNRELITETFDVKNVNVYEAVNGKQALEMLPEVHPDIIIMDIRMPVMDGIEATAEIRKMVKYKDLPVIAFTASVVLQNLKEIKDGLFDDILLKPLNLHKMIQTLKKYIGIKENENRSEQVLLSDDFDYHIDKEYDVAKIIEELEGKLMKEWRSINESHIIDEMEVFAKDLETLSKENNILILQRYALKLLELIDEFDVDGLAVEIQNYPEYVDKLKTENRG